MLQWYGYIHQNDTLHLKRYLDDYLDILEARSSSFVKVCFDPFYADDHAHAWLLLEQKAHEFTQK